MDLPGPLAWLVDEASASTGPDRFLAELGSRLLADGLPLAGGALALAVPHPIIARRTFLWRAETGAVIESLAFAGAGASIATMRQINLTLSLAFLAPQLVKAAVEGRLPRVINIERLRHPDPNWAK